MPLILYWIAKYATPCLPGGVPAPSLTFVDGSQNGRVTDDVLPPRLIAAMRRSIGPRLGQSALLSSFMKYRLVFVASVGKELDSLPRALARSEHVCSLSDVPSYNFTNWVREKKNDGQTDLLLPSIAVYRLFWQRRCYKKEESEGGCIDQPEEWRGST